MNEPQRPGLMGFLIAASLPVLAVVGTITVVAIVAVTGIYDLGTIEGSDGSVTLTVPDAGAYDCYAEGDGFQPNKANFKNLDVVATATPGGSITVGRPNGSITYNVDNGARRGIAIRTIHFPSAGSYTLQTQWKDGTEPPGAKIVSRLKFGRMNFLALGASALGGCCTTVIALIIAVVLAIVTWNRRSAWDKLYGPGSAPPMASFDPPGAQPDHRDGWGDTPLAGSPPSEDPDPYRPPLNDVPPQDDGDRLY